MCHELMHTPPVVAAAFELEMLLADLGLCVLADTIETYWSPLERAEVLVWISGMFAARKLDDNRLVPSMPQVLVPFYDASRAVDAA